MYLWRALGAALAGVGLFAPFALADSTQRNALSYVTQIDDAVLGTPSHRVHAYSSFDLTFLLHSRQQKIRLSLTPNHDIISDDATMTIVGADGIPHTVEPIDRLEHRVFKGEAFIQPDALSEWRHVGWARIYVHRDGDKPIFEGAFRIDGNHHHVQTNIHYLQTMVHSDPQIPPSGDEYMVVWRDSDIQGASHGHHGSDELKRDVGEASSCSSDELIYNRDEDNLVYRSLSVELDSPEQTSPWYMSPRSLFGRQIDGTTGSNGAGVNLTTTIGSTSGCPTTRKVALVGIAADCNYVSQFNSTASVRANIIQQIGSASQVYESTFNITLGIQNLTITDATCPTTAQSSAPWNVACSDSVTITDRLNLFSAWRGQYNDTNAYWTLLSTCNTGAAVGLAWLGEVCNTGSTSAPNETIAGANVVVRTSTEWQVIAHETGHTFGAVHDCISSTCADGTVTKQQCCPLSGSTCNANGAYIMNPSTGSSITNFSPCSIGNICSFLGRNTANTGCLKNNKDVTTITGSQCGNGIVESGEECDCGGTSGCGSNSCCNPTTCKFTTNSVCDPANEECCTSTCQYASSGTVCRTSTGSCDPQEVCTGSSGMCPSDSYSADGTTCGASNAGLTCASGQCTSRDLQCKVYMGSLTTDNDTYSCSSSGCLLSCASPEFGYNTCYTMQQNFLDGTTCEGGGKCSNGNCVGASVANEISSWISDNEQIVIPVACVVGIVLLLAFTTCIVSCCRRRRYRARAGPVRGQKPLPAGMVAAAAVPPGGRPSRAQMRDAPPPYSEAITPPPNAQYAAPRSRSYRYA